MTLTIPPDFAEVAVQFTHSSDPQPWYVTFGVDLEGTTPPYTTIATNIADRWMETIGVFLSTDAKLTGVRMTIGTTGDDNLTVFVPLSIDGPASQDMLPQNCALLVQKLTDQPGRRGKGRFFVPGVLQEQKVNAVGGIESEYLSDLQSAATNFWTEMGPTPPGGGESYPLVVLHNENPGSEIPPSPITALIVSPTIATQRRRLRR